MAAGVATHYCKTDDTPLLERELMGLSFGSHPHADIEDVLDGYAGDPGESHVNQVRPALKTLFDGHATFDALYAGLKADGHDVANEILRILERMSPTSLRLTFEQMKRGARLDFDESMKMEFRMVRRCMEGHDFFEGVRALIIDKDKSPRWSPATVEGVGDADIVRYFEPLTDGELELP
jgi:hypothetical protein